MRGDNAKYCHGKLITAPHRMATTTMITICHTGLYNFIASHIFIHILCEFLVLKYTPMVVIVVLVQLDLCLDWNVETRKEQYAPIYFTYYTIYIAYLWSYLAGQARVKRPSHNNVRWRLATIYAMFVSTSIYYFLWPDLRFPAIRSIIVVVSDGDELLTIYRG